MSYQRYYTIQQQNVRRVKVSITSHTAGSLLKTLLGLALLRSCPQFTLLLLLWSAFFADLSRDTKCPACYYIPYQYKLLIILVIICIYTVVWLMTGTYSTCSIFYTTTAVSSAVPCDLDNTNLNYCTLLTIFFFGNNILPGITYYSQFFSPNNGKRNSLRIDIPPR